MGLNRFNFFFFLLNFGVQPIKGGKIWQSLKMKAREWEWEWGWGTCEEIVK